MIKNKMNKTRSKRLTRFTPRIRSRHPSHSVLRKIGSEKPLGLFPFKSVIRFGSASPSRDVDVEINTTKSIANSASKMRMKNCFFRDGVRTALAYRVGIDELKIYVFDSDEEVQFSDLPYPLIAKPFNGSRGNGIKLIKDSDNLLQFMKNHNSRRYLIEKYYNFSREYRLHISKFGCFYTNRKMVKNDTPDDERFVRNDKNCVWILENNLTTGEPNPMFDKPSNWQEIVDESVKALHAVGLDVGAVDVRTQSPKITGSTVDFIIVEINSAPSFGNITAEMYKKELPRLLTDKWNNK